MCYVNFVKYTLLEIKRLNHTKSGVHLLYPQAHLIWCCWHTSQHTQYGVYSTPRVVHPEWQILECSTHPLLCVLYTLDVGVLIDCASDTAVDTVHTRYLHKIQCTMHIQVQWYKQPMIGHACSTYSQNKCTNILPVFSTMFVLQVKRMKSKLRNSYESTHNHYRE